MRNESSHFVTIAIGCAEVPDCVYISYCHMHSGACKVGSLELRAGCLPAPMTNATVDQNKPVNGR